MASKAAPLMNPWEGHALSYVLPDQPGMPTGNTAVGSSQSKTNDNLIYPGLYSGTGFDLMSILLQVSCRPHPTIQLGPVDCSVAIVVCDLEAPDTPIAYASDAFSELTGYPLSEVQGRNCRFLQTPGPGSPPGLSSTSPVDKMAIQRIRHAVHNGQEIQLEVYNYKRNGQPFTNILSVIPIQLAGHRYSVGFLCEKDT